MQPSNRQRLIRLIHVAKRDLSLDDDTYRSILQRFGRKESSSDLTVPELEQVLEHLKRSGFKVRSKGKPAKPKAVKAKPSRPLAQDAESKKIRALWLFLHELGAVKNPSEEALASYVKRLEDVEAICRRFTGVGKAFALQAGREVRVMVQSDQVDDAQAVVMSRELARAIESESAYPGQVRVVVVRETRASDYAR